MELATVYRMEVESLIQGGELVFFMSSDGNTIPRQKRLDLRTDEIMVMNNMWHR